jgi:threonine/homoserine/homoserine lactone efflux protein
LAWDVGYFVAAFIVIVVCAGCILRQAWARPVLRVVALVLCVWFAYRAVLSWQQWHTLKQAAAVFLASGPSTLQSDQLAYLQRLALVGTGIGIVAVLVLLWLAWQLGQPAVRLQFRSRRG